MRRKGISFLGSFARFCARNSKDIYDERGSGKEGGEKEERASRVDSTLNFAKFAKKGRSAGLGVNKGGCC